MRQVAIDAASMPKDAKIAILEKKVSEEHEVTTTLKRKLQEETMVRKFKERRLNYLQGRGTSEGVYGTLKNNVCL